MKEINLQEMKKRLGCLEQLFGITRYTYAEGKAKGVDAVEVRNGDGLRYVVLPDRGMDIGLAEFKGVPFAHISPVGIVAPTYFEPHKDEWLRSFTAGLLTTCGLDQVGDSCENNDTSYSLHGRIANTPAEKVSVLEEEIDGRYKMSVSGLVRQAKESVQNLTLRRTITTYVGESSIHIQDRITNESFLPSPFMILYHMNLGYPFLDEDLKIEIPHSGISSMYEGREEAMRHALQAEPPQAGYSENVFFLEAVPDEHGNGQILAYRTKTKTFALKITFPAQILPRVAVWKQMGCQDYVMAVEPCNNWVGGQAREEKLGTLEILAPGQSKQIDITIEILEEFEK